MRPSSTSVSMVFAQIAGWLTVGLLMWLLMLTHNVVGATLPTAFAAPITLTATGAAVPAEAVSITTAAAGKLVLFPIHTSGAGSAERRPATAGRVRHRNHVAFWQARETNRQTLAGRRRTMLGLLLPFRSHHRRVDVQRADQRHPLRKHYERTHAKTFMERLKLGPALGQKSGAADSQQPVA